MLRGPEKGTHRTVEKIMPTCKSLSVQSLTVKRVNRMITFPLCTKNPKEECKNRIIVCPELYPVCLPEWYENDYRSYRKNPNFQLKKEA